MTQPLDQVLARRGLGQFYPRHPDRRPWVQPLAAPVEVAYTGNSAVVPVEVADRAHVQGLERPTWDRDDLEFTDWMPVGWAVAP